MFVINATDYAPIDPLTPPCDVNQINIGYVGENHARCLVFDLTECVAQFGEGGFAISFIRHGDYLPYLVTDTDRLENNAIWLINSTDTAVEGYGMVQLQYIVGTTVVKSALYQTVTFASNEIPGNVPDPYEDLLTQIAAYAATAEGAATTATAAAQTASTAVENGIKTERSQRIAADNGLQEQITAIRGAVGAPEMASSSTDFVETNKIYVYTGNEPGYTFGNWYYYNGAEWVSGGVYNATAFETDKTLTVEDMAADAKVTGDRINAAFVTEQTSGSVASFDDGADNVPLKDLVVNITARQSGSGDPSPDNIRPITGFDAANIYVANKNLAKIREGSGQGSGITATANTDGTVSLSGTSTGTGGAIVTSYVHLKPGRYYIKGVYSQNEYYPRLDGSTTSNRYYPAGGSVVNVTIEDDYRMRIVANTSGVNVDGITFVPIIYYTDTATDEVVISESNQYSISLGSAGTVYGGTLDVTTGMLTVTHGSCTISERSWNYDATYTRFTGAIPNMVAGKYAVRKVPFMCSAFLPIDDGRAIGNVPDNAIYGSGTSQAVYIKTTDYTTVSDFVNAVGNERIVYELANPISYQLSPTDVKTILGQNNIWCDTGDITNLEYRADTRLYIEHLTSPDGDMVADANIANGSYFMVNNRLYLATAAIASGASIVPGTNCTETNLAAALNAINA